MLAQIVIVLAAFVIISVANASEIKSEWMANRIAQHLKKNDVTVIYGSDSKPRSLFFKDRNYMLFREKNNKQFIFLNIVDYKYCRVDHALDLELEAIWEKTETHSVRRHNQVDWLSKALGALEVLGSSVTYSDACTVVGIKERFLIFKPNKYPVKANKIGYFSISNNGTWIASLIRYKGDLELSRLSDLTNCSLPNDLNRIVSHRYMSVWFGTERRLCVNSNNGSSDCLLRSTKNAQMEVERIKDSQDVIFRRFQSGLSESEFWKYIEKLLFSKEDNDWQFLSLCVK
ncbi:MAG: hypothetical protein JBO36_05010 [Candidatus Thiodiazotropha taylori]|nr:hypothetical protein [Candidatus Thiodiazotropha taylori]